MAVKHVVAALVVAFATQWAGAAEPAPVAPVAPAAASAAAAVVGNPQFQLRPVDDAWRAALPRNADAATQAYLDRLPAATVARANAFVEGGYWLLLWNFLLGLAVAAVLLGGRRSARLRDWAQRVGRKAFFRDALFGAFYALAGWLLSLPLSIYQGYFREHAYGMANQSFGAWFGEQLLAQAVGTLVTALAVGALYVVIRRTGERWWLWGAAGAVGLMTVGLLVVPAWIEPLFNTYKPVENGPLRDTLLAMAQANGVPANDIFEFDASRQTTRISASVSGIFGTAAVRLNDNLLRRTSPAEVRAVMAHELGHYVMNHITKSLAQIALLSLAGFLFTKWALDGLLARHGERLGLRGASDVASLPLLAAVFSVFLFVATPVVNTLIRTQEIEADRFGFNLAREPHGAAEAYLQLTEYRKPDPGPIEEMIFFDHPSTRFRVHDAMRWREAMGAP